MKDEKAGGRVQKEKISSFELSLKEKADGRTAKRSEMVARGKSDEIGRHPWIRRQEIRRPEGAREYAREPGIKRDRDETLFLSPAKAGAGRKGDADPSAEALGYLKMENRSPPLKRWATKNRQSIAATGTGTLPPVSQHHERSPEVRMGEARIAHHGELSTTQAFRF